MQYLSNETHEPVVIECRFCGRNDEIQGRQSRHIPATHLAGQWEGGDEDIEPRWVPVCEKHLAGWFTEECVIPQPDGSYAPGTQEIPTEYRLPTFSLKEES